MTVIVSPGHAFTASNSRSASSATSVRCAAGGTSPGAARWLAACADSANARSTAAFAAVCCSARCSRTSRSIFASNVSGIFVVMRQKSHAAIPASTHPLNGYFAPALRRAVRPRTAPQLDDLGRGSRRAGGRPPSTEAGCSSSAFSEVPGNRPAPSSNFRRPGRRPADHRRAHVTPLGSDMGSIKPMVEQVEARTGVIPDKVLADANHATIADIRYLAARGIEALVSCPHQHADRPTRSATPRPKSRRGGTS